MQELTRLFPRNRSQAYYREKLNRLGGLNHFNLISYPNKRLPYNPVYVLLNVNGAGILSQLLYLGLALHDYKNAIGQTEAFKKLTHETNETYRGALFEIEVGALLVRSGLKPTYRTTTPDFIVEELPLGVEAKIRDVPFARWVAEQLFSSLAFLEFKHLFIELKISGEHDSEELIGEITKDVEQLLEVGDPELSRPRYLIRHDLSGGPTVTIVFGKYRYEETLSQLITNSLKDKEKQICQKLAGLPEMPYVVALDTRSLFALPLEPDSNSDYEQQMAEIHRPYYDRLRFFRQQIVLACQSFVAQSPLIKGVLLWDSKRTNTPADEVHRRCSIYLVTADQSIEVDKQNLEHELKNMLKNGYA
jgi:hypothetical protein